MLRRLHISNFALIESIDLTIDGGMTVLLGETGAGKSIIIDALAAALGERLPSDSLRSGAKKAVIEAVFHVAPTHPARGCIARHELDWEAEDIILRRELTASGTSRCFVNDTPTQANVVREIAVELIDFHGQHDTHGLLDAETHRTILDMAALSDDDRLRMRDRWLDLRHCTAELAHLQERARTADAERARLAFIVDEISQIAPQPGEDELIAAELRRAESQEQVVGFARTVRDALYAGDTSAYDAIQSALTALRHLLPFQPDLDGAISDLESARVSCKESAASVGHLADGEDFSPERLESLRQRQLLLQRLVRKYGSLTAACEQLDAARQELLQLDSVDDALQTAEQARRDAQHSAEHQASVLHALRVNQSAPLATAVADVLVTMGMPSAVFHVSITPGELGISGSDGVEFMFSSNAGEPTRGLGKVASGGELSRVMLALKRALAQQASHGTMVFDEIDTGISGRVARTVGEVMKTLAASHQILCITHLAQIASLADHFVQVTKTETDGQTTVRAQSLDADQALVEVAKLLSGEHITDTSLSGARELMTSLPRAKSPRAKR